MIYMIYNVVNPIIKNNKITINGWYKLSPHGRLFIIIGLPTLYMKKYIYIIYIYIFTNIYIHISGLYDQN